MNIDKALGAEADLLDELFGIDRYDIEKIDGQTIKVRADWLELTLSYDFRDQFVSSYIKPRNVEPNLSEKHLGDTFVQFLEIEPSRPMRGPLDRLRIREPLEKLRPVIDVLKDPARSRDACFFALGYNVAYNDWASGKF